MSSKLGVLVTEIQPFDDWLRSSLNNSERRIDNFDVLVINSPRGVKDATDWFLVAKFPSLKDDVISDHLTEAKRSFRGYDRSIASAIQVFNTMEMKCQAKATWMLMLLGIGCRALLIMNYRYPCGAASRDDLLEALKLAVKGTHFGGPFGGVVTFLPLILVAHSDKKDYEVVVAPSYNTEKALEILCGISKELTVLEAKKKGKKPDELSVDVDDIRFISVAEKCPTKMELDDIRFAWLCVKHSGRNLVVAKNKFMLGSGKCGEKASMEYGLKKAIADSGKEAKGSVLASDVFFPSDRMDLVQEACEKGVSVIVGCSGGRNGDGKAIERCNKYGVSLLFAEVSNSRQ